MYNSLDYTVSLLTVFLKKKRYDPYKYEYDKPHSDAYKYTFCSELSLHLHIWQADTFIQTDLQCIQAIYLFRM